MDYVVIATIHEIRPVNGDAGTLGEVLIVRIDAVLRGDLALDTTEIFNPPLGAPGWPWFTAGGQFLIAADPAASWSHGLVATNACAPNEEIVSPDRIQELIALSPQPVLSNTAMRPPSLVPIAGLGLLALAAAVAVRRRIGPDDHLHRRDDGPPAAHAGGASSAADRPA